MIIFPTFATIAGRRNNRRKACFTELAILETMICTKEHRGLARQAAPSCPRSQLHYMVDAAFIIKSKVSRINTKDYWL